MALCWLIPLFLIGSCLAKDEIDKRDSARLEDNLDLRPPPTNKPLTPGSVFFKHIQTFHASQSSWLISLTYDTEVYMSFLNELAQNIHLLEGQCTSLLSTEQSLVSKADADSAKVYRQMFEAERTALKALRADFDDLRMQMIELQLTHNHDFTSRRPRSLFPFIGTIFKKLIGVADEQTVREIKAQLRLLASTDRSLAHLTHDSLTLINATRLDVDENRKTVNTLIDVTGGLQRDLSQLAANISDLVLPFKSFMLHYVQISHHIILARNSLVEARLLLDELKAKISVMALGRVTPTLLSSAELMHVLQSIEDNLPSTVKLPFDLGTQLFKYYETLHCTVVQDNSGFLVLITVPLNDLTSEFDLFEAVPLPIPHDSGKYEAYYDLPHRHFALSTDLDKITFLSDEEAARCTLASDWFCVMSGPIYPTSYLTSDCLTALVTHTAKAPDVCKIRVRKIPYGFTKALHLGNGNWVLAPKGELPMTILCPDSPLQHLTLQGPVATLTLAEGCYARSQEITLPPYFFKHTSMTLATLHLPTQDPVSLWDPVTSELTVALATIPDKLDEIIDSELTISELKQRIGETMQELDPIFSETTEGTNFVYYTCIVLLVLLPLGAVIAYCLWYRKGLGICRYSMKQKSKSDNKGWSLPDTCSRVHQDDGEVTATIPEEIPLSLGAKSTAGELNVPELGPSTLVMNFK